nr:UDP-3-O-(3-hydroxymyristoyl)glucosamine N-acyltransferase [Bacteroidota bacterium]
MIFTAKEIAHNLNGSIVGNEGAQVNSLAKIEDGKPGSISFLANPKYTKFVYSSESSIIIVGQDFIPEKPVKATLIKVENPYASFAKLLDYYNKIKLDKKGISARAHISPSATIGNDVYIGEFAFIGENSTIGDGCKIYPQTYIGDNVTLGNNTTLFPGVKVYSDNSIGSECVFHSGVVIGGDGFGFVPVTDDNYNKIAQIGNVIIEDYVEIGANTSVDRATLGSTIIRKGAKLDNLIQIGHNVEIGENTIIVAQTGISGSTKIGKNCVIAGQVGITGHLIIGDNAKIAAQSGVSTNVKEGAVVFGSPAFEASKYRKAYVHFRNFQKIVDRIDKLEDFMSGKDKA